MWCINFIEMEQRASQVEWFQNVCYHWRQLWSASKTIFLNIIRFFSILSVNPFGRPVRGLFAIFSSFLYFPRAIINCVYTYVCKFQNFLHRFPFLVSFYYQLFLLLFSFPIFRDSFHSLDSHFLIAYEVRKSSFFRSLESQLMRMLS